jgi:hypothetical protein
MAVGVAVAATVSGAAEGVVGHGPTVPIVTGSLEALALSDAIDRLLQALQNPLSPESIVYLWSLVLAAMALCIYRFWDRIGPG